MNSLGSNVTIKKDNTSAIRLERNRGKSHSKRTKQITIRYFYITDRLKSGDVNRVIYKSMEEMELNNLTKALKGRLFHTHCKTLMGLRGLMNTYLTRSIKIKHVRL